MEHTARTQARRPGRWAVIAGVSLIALGLLSFNAFAFFTATATATHDTDTGDMELTLGAAGANHRIGTASTNIVPGDTIQRTIQLNVSNQASTMSGVTLDTTGSTNVGFITDTTDGLKVWIARCSQAWTEAGVAPAYTYTCGGSQSDVLGTNGSPVAFYDAAHTLNNLDVSDGATNYLMVEVSWPDGDDTAQDAMEASTGTLSFGFEGTQRAGTDK